MNQSEFRPVKHLKMTVWTSVLWKMNIHMAKKWPEMVVTLSFISIFHFRSDCSFKKIQNIFSGKSLTIFVTPILKLSNRYYHTFQIQSAFDTEKLSTVFLPKSTSYFFSAYLIFSFRSFFFHFLVIEKLFRSRGF